MTQNDLQRLREIVESLSDSEAFLLRKACRDAEIDVLLRGPDSVFLKDAAKRWNVNVRVLAMFYKINKYAVKSFDYHYVEDIKEDVW